ncbi:MAG: NAD(P)-dependent oxidoreductase [Nocardia sp.]|uniref:NAD-dependent epimerase/dehydratase family protein n=1 Tax=Nocardia sp. TaxID=1821 RepID=UPI0026145CC5|nr:NAD-dependent epimerase/dehydratase family protein [Nocardia sp.]MCU1644933.1 NAD(P)-dependent oxidoreductase [Nocardia sp.]
MRVAVIGGSGYLGALIADRCQERGHSVVALSRHRGVGTWEHQQCDLTAPGLGAERARAAITEADVCVFAAGSVSWQSSSTESLQVHDRGIATLLQLVESAANPPRLVHVSSILALGEPDKAVASDQLFVGQRFRNWYEYGKYVAEHRVRQSATRHNIVRFGPLLGLGYDAAIPDIRYGLPALFPMALAGYPIPITDGGQYPCYVGDVLGAAELVVDMAEWTEFGRTVTWFDPQNPSLCEILTRICLPFGKYPRIIKADTGRAEWLMRTLMRRIGTDANLTDYAHGWVDVDARADSEFTREVRGREGYIQQMSAAMAGQSWSRPQHIDVRYTHA